MRKSRHGRTRSLSLDSLVDIVSNTVGILIILAVFMALFAQMVIPEVRERARERPEGPQPPEKLLIPWSHATNRNAVFFYVHRDRVHHLDLTAFYQRLAAEAPQADSVPITLELPGMTARYYPVTNHVFCLEFRPEAGHGEPWPEARSGPSAWRQARRAYPREKFYYFFWVTGDSFDVFRSIRDTLWEEQVEVGWKPVRPDAPLEICNGFDGSRAFQPQ